MNVPYPDIPQAGLISRLPALFGMAARGDRLVLAGGGQTGCVDGMEDTGLDCLEIFQDAFTAQAQKLRHKAGLFPAVDALSHVEREKPTLLCGMLTDFLSVFIQSCSKRRKVRNRG